MLILTAAGTDKLRLIPSAAATLDVHASWADVNPAASPIVVTPGRTNTAFTTAVEADIVATPATNFTRNVKTLHVRNKHASLSCDVTIIYSQNGTEFELHKATLVPGATLEYIEGVGFFTISSAITNLKSFANASQTGFAADTYLVGSSIAIPANMPIAGTTYKLYFDITKTGAGVAAIAVNIRVGTAGAIGDAARLTFTFNIQTGVIDAGHFECLCVFRTVGSGTSAVLQGIGRLEHQLASTGLSSVNPVGYQILVPTSSGFDSTVANSFIGASYNAGASAAHTIQLVRSELIA